MEILDAPLASWRGAAWSSLGSDGLLAVVLWWTLLAACRQEDRLRAGSPPVRVMAAAAKPAKPAEPAEREEAVSPSRPDVTQASAVQRFNFDDENVLGDMTGPEGEPLTVVVPATHASLIEIRQHFVPEMVKSLEDL